MLLYSGYNLVQKQQDDITPSRSLFDINDKLSSFQHFALASKELNISILIKALSGPSDTLKANFLLASEAVLKSVGTKSDIEFLMHGLIYDLLSLAESEQQTIAFSVACSFRGQTKITNFGIGNLKIDTKYDATIPIASSGIGWKGFDSCAIHEISELVDSECGIGIIVE